MKLPALAADPSGVVFGLHGRNRSVSNRADFAWNVIHVRKPKFGTTRTVPFIDVNFKADLRQFVRGRTPSEPVFEGKRRMIQKIVQKAAELAGITNPYSLAKHVSPHLFRHSIARELKRAGYQAEFIQKFLGHPFGTL